jgi:predicted permease
MLFRRRAVERELDDELAFHLEKSAEQYERAGHARAEAMRRARLDLHVESVKEDVRDARGGRLIADLGTDVRYGVRILRRSPAFTLIAVLTLALGIGANTAMFAVVEDVLMHPLPYDQPGQLVRLHASKPSFERGSISYPNFLDWQAQNHSFATIAASRGAAFTMTGAGTAERVSADLVSPDYFAVLGVQPLVGHTFTREDAVALLGEKLWKRKFAGSRDVVGKQILLDGTSYVVAGVMPARSDLRAVSGGQPADVYIPITQRDRNALQARGAGLGIHGIGRLKPGVTIAQARADMAGVTSGLAATYPETNKSVGATIDPLEESVIGNLRPYLLVLFAAVGLLLLIACVNVANLLLARAAVRSHELAIRVAVGASFGRLMRQLLTESLLLALAGGAFGLLVAWWSTDVLLAMLPGRLSHVEVNSLDGSVLVFTVGLSLVAGVLTGVMPALKAIRPNLYDTIKEGGRGYTAKNRSQSVFVVLQTAMAVVLLVGAGLLVRTMVHLATTDPGYRPNNVVTFGLSLSPSLQSAPPATIRASLRELQTAIANAPGVEAAAFTLGVPMESGDQSLFYVEGKPKPATSDQMDWTVESIVGPEYLATMKVPLQRGRFFTEHDNQTSPDVVVIDDAFARQYFPGQDPVGKHLYISTTDFEPVEIIGVVGHVKMWGLDQEDSFKVRAQLWRARTAPVR